MKYIAFVTKGLESISEAEISQLSGVTIELTGQKFIHFKFDGDINDLKTLRTVDDVGIYISEIPAGRLLEKSLAPELEKIKQAIELLKVQRNIRDQFSMTVSKYKNKFITDDQVKDVLSPYFASELNLKYTPRNHTNLDIRFSITEYFCTVSVKLFPQSLYRRSYSHESYLGSIRSTIAASMLYKLTRDLPPSKVVDNLCGSGTFLCESLLSGHDVYGVDIDPDAIKIAGKNLQRISKDGYEIMVSDATNTLWKEDSFDIAFSNFPWDKLIKVRNQSILIEGVISEYSRILKNSSRVGFITTRPELLIEYIRKYFKIKEMESIKIGYMGQVPTIILAKVSKG